MPATLTTPTIAEDFRAFLLADTDIAALVGERIHQHYIPDEARATYPRLWYRKAEHNDMPDLDGETGGLLQTTFDLEVLADDPDQLDTLTEAVRARLNGYPPTGQLGTFGSRTVLGIFAEDHDEEYLYRGIGEDDEGTFASALSVLVIHAPYGE